MDERLLNIQKEQQNAVTNSNNIYQGLLDDSQALHDQQQNFLNEQEKIQNANLDKQLANQTQKIEQQKQVAQQNFETESKKALNDYTAFTNPYGYQAEAMASQGLSQSGVSETAKLGGFNTYQNRLAVANKTMQDAFTSYDMAINDAILNNDVAKAENALNKLAMSLEYSTNFFNNKSSITQNQMANQQALNSEYYNRYQTEYQNIQNEKAQAEAIRQFNKQFEEEQRQYNQNLAYQKSRDKVADSQWQKEYDLAKKKSSVSGGSGGNGSGDDEVGTPKGGAEVKVIANPSTGTIHEDAKNGVFKNGYQPNNVDGKPLKESKYKVSDIFGSTAISTSGKNLGSQKIWKTSDGNYYVWEGSQNDYIKVTDAINNVTSNSYIIWGTNTSTKKQGPSVNSKYKK